MDRLEEIRVHCFPGGGDRFWKADEEDVSWLISEIKRLRKALGEVQTSAEPSLDRDSLNFAMGEIWAIAEEALGPKDERRVVKQTLGGEKEPGG